MLNCACLIRAFVVGCSNSSDCFLDFVEIFLHEYLDLDLRCNLLFVFRFEFGILRHVFLA